MSPGRMAPLAAALLVLPATAPASYAEPNPYGDRSVATTVVLHADGSYDVTVRQRQTLVREFRITFGGAVHDGFRLADDGELPPPYLRAAYTLTSVQVAAGQPAPGDFTRTNHRIELTSSGTYPAGEHEFAVEYAVRGAARPTGTGWAAYVRLLDLGYQPGDSLTIDSGSVRPDTVRLRCVTHPPDSTPCGEGNPTLTYTNPARRDVGVPPEFVIVIEGAAASVAEPAIDRR